VTYWIQLAIDAPLHAAPGFWVFMFGASSETFSDSSLLEKEAVRICEAHFGKTFHPASLGRLLKRLGFSRQKARPSHPKKDPAQAEAFKKGFGAAGNHQYSS
jgi:Winged helix-turn helix